MMEYTLAFGKNLLVFTYFYRVSLSCKVVGYLWGVNYGEK